jgi:flagellar motor switch protein FliM
MASDKADPVLRRKAKAARAQIEARVMSPARGLRLALERTAARALSMPLGVLGTERLVADPASLLEMVAEGALLMSLDGPEGAAHGALALDPALTAALVEAQTTGTVAPRATPGRAPTRTDAALCAPVFDAVLARFAANMAAGPDAGWTGGHATGSMQAAPHALRAMLTADRYHVFRVSVKLGEAGREGAFVLALPVVVAASADTDGTVAAALPDPRWQARVLGTTVRMDAVLCRLELPLAEVLALKPGDVVPIAREALRDVALEPGTRRTVARAGLGQMGGRRALRLTAAAPGGAGGDGSHEWIAAGLSASGDAPDRDTTGAEPEGLATAATDAVDEQPGGQDPPAGEAPDDPRLSDAELEALTR